MFRRFNPKDVEMQCWWEKLLLTGSEQPVSRENAALMFGGQRSHRQLYMIGGATVRTGAFPFEVYQINPQQNQWVKKKDIKNSISQNIGSRPVFSLDPKT